jgi:hypothetical protein
MAPLSFRSKSVRHLSHRGWEVTGEARTFRQTVDQWGVGYGLALKPSPTWRHGMGAIGSLEEAARAATWAGPHHAGAGVAIERAFRDGHTEAWWALAVVVGPFGPQRAERAGVVTPDPLTLPELTTWYLITNLPAPGAPRAATSPLAAARLAELVRLYGLRTWVEQSSKQVKHTLGWAQYQVRRETAMQRHWALVCCAFPFGWWQASHDQAVASPLLSDLATQPTAPPQKKESNQTRAPTYPGPALCAKSGLGSNPTSCSSAIGTPSRRCPHPAPSSTCLTGQWHPYLFFGLTVVNKLPVEIILPVES